MLSCLSSLDLNKANGPASIPPKVINLAKNIISVPLLEIINLCFTSGTFPDHLKTAIVLPFYKKGNKLDCNNYRPISLPSNIDKVFEKLIYKRIYNFLMTNKSLYTNQFGFRKNYSTLHALLNMHQKIADSLDKGNYAMGIFIDLQKAFERLIMIFSCKSWNITVFVVLHTLFFGTSYLIGRMQFVSISGNLSLKELIRHGVPQGSVLGPLPFLIYINDLHSAIN